MGRRAPCSSRRPCRGVRRHGRADGFTLVEAVLAAALFSLLLVAFSQAVQGAQREDDTMAAVGSTTLRVHDALLEVADGVRNSAFTSDGAYPQVLTPAELTADGWNTGTPHPSEASDETNRGIVFLLPADADDDGRPDVNEVGEAVWDAVEFAYVLAPDPSGRNRIERWVAGAFDEVVARRVETLTIDSNATAPTEVPLGCLRIRIVVGGSSDGHDFSRRGELTVRIAQNATNE